MTLSSRPAAAFVPSYGRGYPKGLTLKVRLARKDEARLVTLPDEVAVLDEHLLTDEDGKPIEQLSPTILQQIADNNNKRIDETGDYCPIVIGHTKDGDHEKDQPEVIGFAGPFRVKKFFNSKKKAIFARWRIFKDKVDLLRKFPRRSVELWVSRWEIDPISVLGATTPDRDLGLVKLSRSGERSYSRITENPTVDPQQIAQQVFALIEQSDTWKFIEQLKTEAEGMGQEQAAQGDETTAPPEGDPTGGDMAGGSPSTDMVDPNGGPPEDDGMTDEAYEGGDGAPPPEEEEEPPVQMAAPVRGKPKGANIYSQSGGQKGDAQRVYQKSAPVAAAPSGGNTFVPSYGKPKQMSRTAADSEKVRLARVERAQAATQEENRQLRVRLSRAERERDLVQIEAEGYVLDRDEELDIVQEMDENTYGNYLVRLKRNYQKAPGNAPGVANRPGMAPIQMSRHAGNTTESKKAKVNEAVALATSKGIKFEDAMAQLTGESVR